MLAWLVVLLAVLWPSLSEAQTACGLINQVPPSTSIFTGTNPCPAAGWTDATSITFTMEDPMPGGGTECGNNGPQTVTINFDDTYRIGCYADGYSIWVLDDGDGVGITSVPNSQLHFIDPPGSSMDSNVSGGGGLPWSGTPFTGVIDPGATPKSLTIGYRVANWPDLNMTTNCVNDPTKNPSYGNDRFAYTLTIVPIEPANFGTTVIRPPWSLTTKEELNTTDLDLTSFWPTFNTGDAGMPTITPVDAMRRCIVEPYGVHASRQATSEFPIMNFHQYQSDSRHKFAECTTALAFSQGTGAMTLAQRQQALYGLLTGALNTYNMMKHGVNVAWIVNGGFGGLGSTLQLAFLAGAWPEFNAEFKARYTTNITNVTARPSGYELLEDNGVWLHGNGNYYFGASDVDGVGQPPGGYRPGVGAMPADPDTCPNSTYQDQNGEPDDSWVRDGYISNVGSYWVSELGGYYAFPKVFAAMAANGNAGLKFFSLTERFARNGSVPDTGPCNGVALEPPDKFLDNSGRTEQKSVDFWRAIKDCSRTINGLSGAALKVTAYTAGCSGHTLLP